MRNRTHFDFLLQYPERLDHSPALANQRVGHFALQLLHLLDVFAQIRVFILHFGHALEQRHDGDVVYFAVRIRLDDVQDRFDGAQLLGDRRQGGSGIGDLYMCFDVMYTIKKSI